mmetsp:Transcript_13760/g.18356  ORF Transcript_13760/g.18356 Transcript_13760/m.18356 type:complete len:407 (-) Transcript_13760:1874-3094(-)
MVYRKAVVVSTARTGLAKSYRGGLNSTHGAVMLGECIRNAVEKTGKKVRLDEVEDVIAGCGFPEGVTGFNIGRNAALYAGCPATTSGSTVNRFCSSGLQAIVNGIHHIESGCADIVVAGGVESISLVQPLVAKSTIPEETFLKQWPALWMPMIETADILAHRYGISRMMQDAYAVECQRRTALAQENDLFQTEIFSLQTKMKIIDKETKQESFIDCIIDKDECNRPGTTYENVASLEPVRLKSDPNATVTAGNASQLSDGASACLLMDADLAAIRGVPMLGILRQFATCGCDPDEMGVGPVKVIPKLLAKAQLSIEDIDLWEINEAFSSVPLYAMRELGIDPAIVNVNGGSVAIGHPFGMTGSRMVGHILLEGQRRKVKYAVVTMCIGGGQGAGALFEVLPAPSST